MKTKSCSFEGFIFSTLALVSAFPKTLRWFEALSGEPAFRDAVGALFKKKINDALKVCTAKKKYNGHK